MDGCRDCEAREGRRREVARMMADPANMSASSVLELALILSFQMDGLAGVDAANASAKLAAQLGANPGADRPPSKWA